MSKYKNCRIIEKTDGEPCINNQCLRCANWHDKLKGKNCFKANVDKRRTGCVNYVKEEDYE